MECSGVDHQEIFGSTSSRQRTQVKGLPISFFSGRVFLRWVTLEDFSERKSACRVSFDEDGLSFDGDVKAFIWGYSVFWIAFGVDFHRLKAKELATVVHPGSDVVGLAVVVG